MGQNLYADQGYALYRILKGLERERQAISKGKGPVEQSSHSLSTRQKLALSRVKLLTTDHPEGIGLKALAQSVQMAVSAASIMVDLMVQKGLLRRLPDPKDRRAVRITLTPQGEQTFLLCHEQFLSHLSLIAQRFSPEEQLVLSRIAEKIDPSS